jgi:hypothetical protein
MTLPSPLNHNMEVLRKLILKGQSSFKDFQTLPGYRTRISNLKLIHKIKIKPVKKTGKNKFGHTFNYVVHRLQNRDHAIGVYLQMAKC